ncbi:MAG: sugar ABC transporter permease [Spirochaetaceae bacterium]|nr:sugar ABC transporter permease [Spirochaetaceae bacterium]
MNTRRRASRWTTFLFLAPSLLGLTAFSVMPMAASLALGLTEWDGLRAIKLGTIGEQWVGVGNYGAILGDAEFWRVLGNTCYFIAIYLPLIMMASASVAILLDRKKPLIAVYRVIYYIPVLCSWVAGALVWKWTLSPEYGMLNNLLAAVGIEGPAWLQDERWAMPGIVLASVWKDMGYFGLILLGGLQGINPSYYESADLEGASWAQKSFRITLPLLTPAIFFVVVICVINSFQLFPQIMVMTASGGQPPGGPLGSTKVMVERIYSYAFKYYKMGYAAAWSWLLFIIILAFTMLQLKLQKRWVNYEA